MTEIAAHRGGAALWPENSAAAFRGAVALGVEQVEFDVQMTADGVPVIFHDVDLDRMTDGTGPLASLTLPELKTLQIKGGGGAVMTLEEGLDILGPSGLILRCEIKPGPGMRPYRGLREATLEAIDRRELLGRTVVTSFHLPTLAATRAEVEGLRDAIWLVADPIIRLTSPQDVARLGLAAGVDHVAPHHGSLREDALLLLRDAGMRVGAFAVLEDEAIGWALDNALTVFTTDRPDAALRIRRARTEAA